MIYINHNKVIYKLVTYVSDILTPILKLDTNTSCYSVLKTLEVI